MHVVNFFYILALHPILHEYDVSKSFNLNNGKKY